MVLGVILTAFGVMALVVRIIPYTSREKLPHEGSAQVVVTEEKVISIPPALAGLAVAGGIGLMVLAARK
jgi:hypothetical protein